ncbi:hypothetical protein FKM82_020257 [Ascaphus truei]
MITCLDTKLFIGTLIQHFLLFRLLSYSICVVPRGVRHFSSCDIFATVTKDEHGTGTASVQACSALLATGGICLIGDMSLHKKDRLDHLQSGKLLT